MIPAACPQVIFRNAKHKCDELSGLGIRLEVNIRWIGRRLTVLSSQPVAKLAASEVK